MISETQPTAPPSTDGNPALTPFHDLDAYIALPRLSGLAMSPDGSRLVTAVATVDAKQTAYVSALWEVDPAGERPARRLTRSTKGESGAAFTASGDLYFTSARPDPEVADEKDPTASVWVIPAEGGEARRVATRRGGVGGLRTGAESDRVFLVGDVLPGADSEEADEALRTLRKDSKVQAILHSSYPIRFWDHDLGPGQPHLLELTEAPVGELPGTVDARGPAILRDLTPDVGNGLRDAELTVARDGSVILATLREPLAGADMISRLVRIDPADGTRTILTSDDDHDYYPGPISPDGATAVVMVERRSTPELAVQISLSLLDLVSGELTSLAPDWDRWAQPVDWFPDGRAVLAIADSDGRAPLFRIDVADGTVTQLTEDGAYSNAVVHPSGTTIFAVQSSYAYPPEVVRLDLGSGAVTRLSNPTVRPTLPGRLDEVTATAADGSPVRAWLALPNGASAESPAPLVLWIHGGPLGSWNAWSWRWAPWNFVAAGYAVLLPDPALSTGYGQEFVQRGWGRWGAEPFTDLMTITDAAEARADIDAEHTAAMGGSFGGYMANWVAGHTNRFDAIVTHASLWALDQFGPTTDAAMYWANEMSPEMEQQFSPHRSVAEIVTPMLVVHGDKDYRVPIGEGLRLWWELLTKSGRPAAADGSTDHRLLYFPDENHWVLTPQHAKIWYQVTIGFVDQWVRGITPELPPALGLSAPPAAAASTEGPQRVSPAGPE